MPVTNRKSPELPDKSKEERLLAENEELRIRLEETEEVLRAIKSGEIDALVVSGSAGDQIYTLQGAEHPYRVLVETMNEGAATLDADGTIIYGNRCLSTMLEVSLEKLLGSEFGSYVAAANYPFFADRLKNVAQVCEKMEIGMVTGAGNRLTVLFSCCPWESSGREGLSVIVTDITPLKEAEETIRRLNRLHAVLAATNHAIVHAQDRDSIFREFCRVAVQLGGFRLAWVGLWDEARVVRIAAASGETRFLDGRGATAITVPGETPLVCNDLFRCGLSPSLQQRAQQYGMRASASVAIRKNEKVIGALTLYAAERDFFAAAQVELIEQMGSDVSFALDNLHQTFLRRQAEDALQEETLERLRTMEELQQKEQLLIQQSRLAALGEMIGNIAHQWRQPLNTLGLLIQQVPLYYNGGELTKEILEGNAEKSMEVIQHMSRTIDDFRTFFRPDTEKVDFQVHAEVSRTLSLIAESLRAQRISVEVAVLGDPVIHGYPNHFSQALMNILLNARDALVERGIEVPRVSIAISSAGGKAVVTITDNAGGIDQEILGKIFDPYFTTKGPQAGTGVGLYMSKALVEKNMGGLLTVRNVEGGAQFTIEL